MKKKKVSEPLRGHEHARPIAKRLELSNLVLSSCKAAQSNRRALFTTKVATTAVVAKLPRFIRVAES